MRPLLVLVLLLLATSPLQAAGENRLLYVVTPGIRDYLEFGGAGILVFDIDKGHRFVRRIATAASAEARPANIKGVCASPATDKLYFTTPKKLYACDLRTGKPLWHRALPLGCDRMAITPDGKALYVPSFEKDTWNVVDTDGKLVRTITTKSGAHNTVCGLDGKRMYLGGLASPYLFIADTASNKVISKCGPFGGAVRPFAVNGAQTRCYVCVNGLLGFEIGDLKSGKKLSTVQVAGFKPGKVKRHGCPSHGIGLTPDEKELWVCDAANSRLHVFDVSAMPPPKQTVSIALREQPGWVTFSLDGAFAYPSTGEVIDTRTKKIVSTLTDEKGRPVHSEKMVEVDFRDGVPVRAGDQFGVGRVLPGGKTTLTNAALPYRLADKPYVILKRAGVEAVIVDNQAVDDAILPKHRAGYSGVAVLRGPGRKENLFVPGVAGLNFEHIHDGTVQPTRILYEPRNAPMQLRLLDAHTAELYQPATAHYALESCQRYQLLADGTIELTIECVPRKRTFRNGYVGLFWASYIHQPKSRAIHFKGHAEAEKAEKGGWVEALSPRHGDDATHPADNDERRFPRDKDFPMRLVFNLSKWRYREPWYFGRSGDVAFVQMFRPQDRVRLTQSPSGGGNGNPAWDFQYFIDNYEVGKRYQMVMRAKLLRFTSVEQVERETAEHRRILAGSFTGVVAEEKKPAAADRSAYRVLGHDRGRVSIVDARGKVEWEYPSRCDGHDIALLSNGNVLLATGPASIAEVSRDKKIVWHYESKPKPGYKGRVEVHAFARLDKGLTMIAESGNRRIVEVNADGKIVHEIPLTVERPDAHRDTRMVRKLDTGNYLVCHEGDGKVREYDRAGKVVWSYRLDLAGRPRSPGHGPEGHGTEVFGALRLPNGNTMIAGGNNNRVIEVTPKGKVVWSIGHGELPKIRLAWVTTLQLLPSGNLIVGNCHAGPDNPQLFEVTRDKKVVWTFNDFKTFGNGLAAAQVLGIKGKVRR